MYKVGRLSSGEEAHYCVCSHRKVKAQRAAFLEIYVEMDQDIVTMFSFMCENMNGCVFS